MSDWTMSLKVGDAVAVKSFYYGYTLGNVVRVTATQLRVNFKNSEYVFTRSDGLERASVYRRMMLEPVTAEVRAKIRRNSLIQVLEKVKWTKVPLEALEVIYKVLKDANQELG